MSPEAIARWRSFCGIFLIVTSRPCFLNRPASLASVSGAKPVQPEMPIATLVSCACADEHGRGQRRAAARGVPSSWRSCFDARMDRFGVSDRNPQRRQARKRAQDARQRAVAHQRGGALDVGREVAVAVASAGSAARSSACASSSAAELCSGRRNSMPCAAASSSMPRMCAVLAIIGCSRRAANVAIDTWSSWLAEVGRLIDAGRMRERLVLAGQRRRGHVRDHEAAVQARHRRSGTAAGATRRRRSASRCGARRSRRPRRSRPPSRRRPAPPARRGSCRRRRSSRRLPANTSGLSVTALASRSSTSAAWRSWSRQAPTTCGWQRRQYGSCTRSSPSRCERRIALPCEQRAVVLRDVDLPRLAAQRVDARIERAVAAARGIDRQRADHERRLEHRLEARAARAAPARSRPACR